jgi:hypothetical protein
MRGTRSEGGIADGDSGVGEGAGAESVGREVMETGLMEEQPGMANNTKIKANK